MSSTVKGTLDYMAPELHDIVAPQEEGQPLSRSAVDLWACGEIAHRLLTMRPVFGTIRALFQYVDQSQSFPEAHLRAHDISGDARIFIAAVMVAVPEQRLTAGNAMKCSWFTSLLPPPSPGSV